MSRPNMKLFFAPAGIGLFGLLTLTGCNERSEKPEDEKVVLAQVPAPVRATIEAEAKGGTHKDIERTTVDGKAAYAASIVVNGKEQDTLIGDDSKVIAGMLVRRTTIDVLTRRMERAHRSLARPPE